MRLVTYSRNGRTALGSLLREEVVDLHRAHRAALKHSGDLDELAVAVLRVPPDLLGLLQGGEAFLTAARRALAFVEEQRAAGVVQDVCDPLTDVELLSSCGPARWSAWA
jgi:hypothetical protein